MNLILRGYHFEVHEEFDDYWPGQMKSLMWLELHNEDCDSHQCRWDMDWDS